MLNSITRRAALVGAFASSTALAVPVARAKTGKLAGFLPGLAEDAGARVNRLMQELANALADYSQGQFRAIVGPSPDGEAQLQNLVRRSIDSPAQTGTAALGRNRAIITVRGRAYTIDTSDVPARRVIQFPDVGAGAWTECLYTPKADARYVYLCYDGRIGVGPLAEAVSDWRMKDARVGVLPRKRLHPEIYVSPHVKVLGRVLA